MNGGPDAPTAADYANANAQTAQSMARDLERRVTFLERSLADTIGEVRRLVAVIDMLLDKLAQRAKDIEKL